MWARTHNIPLGDSLAVKVNFINKLRSNNYILQSLNKVKEQENKLPHKCVPGIVSHHHVMHGCMGTQMSFGGNLSNLYHKHNK